MRPAPPDLPVVRTIQGTMSTPMQAERREQLGSRNARKLRAAGRLPISIQGEGKPNCDASIDLADFLARRRHHESLFDIQVGGETETAVVRELQWDSFGDQMIHAEFRRVVRGVETDAEVDLVFTGQAMGGVLNQLATTIKIKTLPRLIPESISVPVELVGEVPLLAGDIPLPEGIRLAEDPNHQVAILGGSAGAEESGTADDEAATEA